MADEDALAQQKWDEEFSWLNDDTLQDRTEFWRNNAPEYPGMAWWSQENLELCPHGQDSTVANKKVVTFDITADHLIGHDPSITLMNYRILGVVTRLRWLFSWTATARRDSPGELGTHRIFGRR